MYIRTYIHMYIRTYIHTYIHTNKHAYLASDQWVHYVVVGTEHNVCILQETSGGKVRTRLQAETRTVSHTQTATCRGDQTPSLPYPDFLAHLDQVLDVPGRSHPQLPQLCLGTHLLLYSMEERTRHSLANKKRAEDALIQSRRQNRDCVCMHKCVYE